VIWRFFLLNSGHGGDLEIAIVCRVAIVIKIWSKLLATCPLRRVCIWRQGYWWRGKKLEAKSTQHQQKASNFARRKILMLLPWLKYKTDTSFVGWCFNQGTTCLKNEDSKIKTTQRILSRGRAPI
jgi:hypothetical protein